MGAGEFLPSAALDTLLIGDSIVLGGNPLKQQERLGPQLQQLIGGNVWPISAGSWGMRNELIYLKQHPDVVANVDQIIFVFNKGDFEQASSWACEFTHPRSKPAIATLYVLKKYVYNWAPCSEQPLPAFKVPDGDWHIELASLMQSKEMQGKKVTFFLYPDKPEEADKILQRTDYEQHATELKEITNADVYNVGRDSRWNTQLYRDGIHPTGEGNKVLSEIISKPEPVDSL